MNMIAARVTSRPERVLSRLASAGARRLSPVPPEPLTEAACWRQLGRGSRGRLMPAGNLRPAAGLHCRFLLINGTSGLLLAVPRSADVEPFGHQRFALVVAGAQDGGRRCVVRVCGTGRPVWLDLWADDADQLSDDWPVGNGWHHLALFAEAISGWAHPVNRSESIAALSPAHTSCSPADETRDAS